MAIKTSSFHKFFAMRVPSCFGTTHRDDEALPSRTPTPRSFTLSFSRKSPPSPPQPVWRPCDTYEDIKTLQHGSEAKSYVTKSTTTGRVYVVKRFTKYAVHNDEAAPQPGEQPLPNEAFVLLKALKPHPNILQAFGCDLFGVRIADLYTAYCNGGDLTEQMLHFVKIKVTPPERFILHVFISLIHALAFIHHGLRWDSKRLAYSKDPAFETASYVHGDFKAENCFTFWSEDAVKRGLPDVVLGDWGFAQPAHSFRGIAGTPSYQAPEIAAVYRLRQTDGNAFNAVMRTTGYMTPAADVWSLGQTIHKLCTGREHVVGANPMTFPARVTQRGMIGVKLGGTRGYETKALQEAVQLCLIKDPTMRPKTDEGGLLRAVAIFQEALEKLE
jgi:serine/threonine protein kinase